MDGDFCKVALEKQIYIKDELPVLMGGKTRLGKKLENPLCAHRKIALTLNFDFFYLTVVTECILQDIKARGHDFTSAYILAKKFEARKCAHKEKPVSGYDCIRDLVGAENRQHFCVATQHPKLKDRMRKIPGVPVIYVNVKGNALGIEPMTEKSKEMMRLNEMEKVKPLDKETARLKRALYAEEEEEKKPAEQAHKPQFKKRKVKGVNPLAMKKKKKKTPPPPKKKATTAEKK